MNHLLFTSFIILFSAQASVNAQQAVLSAGQSVSGTGSVSYSIGQVVYTPNSTGTISVTQGVQQTYSGLVSGVDEKTELQMNVYPNPTSEWLILELQEVYEYALYQLLDENGRVLQMNNITSSTTNISMSGLADGTYILRIMKNNLEIQTAKIIKSNQL